VLLAKGADINAKENDALLGMTALVAAAGMGHLDVVQALLARGADVNGKIGLDNTALMAAAKNGHLDLVPRHSDFDWLTASVSRLQRG
jgi:uncharacterized protein